MSVENGDRQSGDAPGELDTAPIRPHLPLAQSADSSLAGDNRRITIAEVFRPREARFLYAAFTLSLIGDQLAKVALAILVFSRTGSPWLTAVTYAIGYLPWIVGGPLLASYADRLPRRTVLIASDLIRAGAVALMTVPRLPLGVLLALLLASSMLAPPFESARSATWPEILAGEVYVVGNAVVSTTLQLGQIFGFAVGGTLVGLMTARGALGVDAVTFLASALCVAIGVHRRPATRPPDAESSVWAETRAGMRLVLGTPSLRAMVLLVWVASGTCFGWEGVVAPWSAELRGSTSLAVGLLLAAASFGTFVGSVVLGRLVRPVTRNRLMMPFAVLAPLMLVPTAWVHSLWLALLPLALTGFFVAFNIPLNGLFVRAVPGDMRGRAFGVAQSGLQAAQGVGVLLVGAASVAFAPSTVIAASGAIGVALVGWIVLRYPLIRPPDTPLR